jgi:DNA-binding NarL/FixJ family response regulator
VNAAIKENPDLCLIDIHMPGNGIAATAEITSKMPNVPVVILTVSRNDDDLFDALRAGAAGYLLKGINPRRLPMALKGVLEGEAALPRDLAARLIDEFRDRGRSKRVAMAGTRGVQLTSRELEVLELLREGQSTGEIAKRLFVSSVTIRSHVASILKKFGVSSREEALNLLAEQEART